MSDISNMSRSIRFKVHKPVKLADPPVRSSASGAAEPIPRDPDHEALLSFATEGRDQPKQPRAALSEAPKPRTYTPEIVVAIVLTVVGAAAITLFLRGAPGNATPEAAATAGSVVASTASIDSRPPGADIVIDGVAHGKTPARIAVTPGRHVLDLTFEGTSRSLVLEVEPGTNVSQYIEFAAPGAAAMGRLEVTSDPSGAQVSVDGQARGRTPLTVDAVPPGEHTVSIANGSNTVTRKVTVTAGNAASIFASVGTVGTAAGWLAVKAPVPLEIYEEGSLLGTNASDRLMLPAGRHQIDLVNTSLEFRQRVTVQVTAGSTSTTAVEVPNGTLSVNALPWADVWIDGRAFGSTPLGNLSIPIGSHEIIWRHPQMGERRRTIAVGAAKPVRVGVDFSQ